VSSAEAIWHDLECGRYTEDLSLWRQLADRVGGPILDVGAGTGRITLELGAAGHAVLALDIDDDLLAVLRERAEGLEVRTIVGDARAFWLAETFRLCIVPMQTIQLLGGTEGRAQFLACARDHLEPRGVLAVAVAETLDTFETVDGLPGPLPDVGEFDGVVYSSRPTAVRVDGDGFELERRRETVTPDGGLSSETNRIHLDELTAEALETEAVAAGLATIDRVVIPATGDYVGTTVVLLRG
jgi:SAM-dependent methyltransferase